MTPTDRLDGAQAVAHSAIDKLAYRIPTAAKVLDMSPATLWRRINDGRIKTVKDCGITLVRRAELERYLDSLSKAA